MENHTKSHKFFLVSVLAASLLLIFLAVYLVGQRTSLTGRASGPSGTVSSAVSLENSYVFASPITAQATGASVIRVMVFLLNDQGLGAASQRVQLNIPGPIQIDDVQPITDGFGRAIFDLTSSSPGDYTITAVASGVTLPHTVEVSFH